MYRIGEFSYLCECTIKTLKHYDKIGVLTPEKVDDFTGYRYYNEKQLKTYHNIKMLQEAEKILKKIKNIFDNSKDNTILEEINKLTENYKEKMAKHILWLLGQLLI